MGLINVLLVDDHSLFREGLKTLLEVEEDLKILEAENGFQAMKMVKATDVNVILMDITMPEMNGIQLCKKIKAEYPDIKVVALTMHEDDRYIIEMIQAGASGFLVKDVSSEQLIDTIRRVHKTKSFVSPCLTTEILSKLSQMPTSTESDPVKIDNPDSKVPPAEILAEAFEELTKREREILKLIAHGKDNSEISEVLDISIKTVRNHITNMFKKIGVEDRNKAAIFAFKAGLVKF